MSKIFVCCGCFDFSFSGQERNQRQRRASKCKEQKGETESLRNSDATKEILRCKGACAVLVAAPPQYAPHPNAVCVYLLEVNTLVELETALWLAWLVEYASYNRPKEVCLEVHWCTSSGG